LLGQWGSRFLVVLATTSSDVGLDLHPDLAVLGFTVLASAVAVILFGLAPAWRAARVDVTSTMRASARAVSGGTISGAGRKMSPAKLLLVGQVAISVVLLAGAALLVRSLRSLESRPLGLDAEHLLIVEVDAGSRGYTDATGKTLLEDLAARFRRIPGVVAASYSENGIFSGTENETSISVPGFTARAPSDSQVKNDALGPGYVAAIGARLLQGREFDGHDRARVALVNESFARFYFGGRSPVGAWFTMDSTPYRIVGVIGDVVDHTLTGPVDRRIYTPLLDRGGLPYSIRFEVRTSGDPLRIAPEVRRTITSVDPRLPVEYLSSLTHRMELSIRQELLLARIASGFGLGALLLAALGLYGVMTYAVTRRTGEIGLRVALGAQRSGVIRLIVRDALVVVLAGFAIGVPVALGTLRYLGSQLHGVGAADPASLASALGVLLVSALAAVLMPALRASRVSPIVALREE
jgi:predicted permease